MSKRIRSYEDFERIDEAVEKFLLTIGDKIIKVDSKNSLDEEYKRALVKWKESGGRPSLEPNLWKLEKAPSAGRTFNL